MSSCRRPSVPKKLDLSGVEIVVWDSLQPDFPGSPNYAEEASRVIQEFCGETGVKVDYRRRERKDVLALLSGDGSRGRPDLMFSSEWPVASSSLADLSAETDPGDYVDPASAYWTRNGKLFGIPAYIQWIGTAVRGGVGRAGAAGRIAAAYWVGSPGFFRAALDATGAGPNERALEELLNEKSLLEYVNWIKQTYGTLRDDPLLAWQRGEVDLLYPATPYLVKWLKASSGGGDVSVAPVSSHTGGNSFYYTVPAYLVLAEGSREQAAAVDLGRRLAANLGRWAARTLGCVPARVDDVPIFNVESGLGYEERQAVWESVRAGTRAVPDAADFLRVSAIQSVLESPVTGYLKGSVSAQTLEESIRAAFLRHTKP